MRRVFQRPAVERDQPLIAVHVGALIDGHGEMPAPEQRPGARCAHRDRIGDLLLVEARAGAHLVGRGEIHDQHAHRSVGLGLQDEAAFELQRGAEQHAEHDRLAEELGDRLRIIVAGEDRVHRRPQPYQATAQVERRHLERQDRVVGRNLPGARLGIAISGFGIGPYLEAEAKNARPNIGR